MYKDTEEVRTKLFERWTRDRWEIWLWDADNTWQSKYGGWTTLRFPNDQTFCIDRDEALAGLALARVTYGPAAILKLMCHTVAEDNDA